MATQRITLAKIAGKGSSTLLNLVGKWSDASTENAFPVSIRRAVDALALRLKTENAVLPVIYYCEWIDRWSMGDDFPTSVSVAGDRFEITCLSIEEAQLFSEQCRGDTQEQQWMASRLHECVSSWSSLVRDSVIVLIRERLGPSVTDDEINESHSEAPSWIADENAHA